MERDPAGCTRRPDSLPKRLHVIHYYTTPWEDKPDGTPEPLMIAVLSLHPDREPQEHVFSVHLLAELSGVEPSQIAARLPDLQRGMLEQFYAYVRANPRARWVHWNMKNVLYGLAALAHRFRVLGETPPDILEARTVNLDVLLKRALGHGYMADPRLEALCEANQLSSHEWLDRQALAEATRAGEYGKMSRSLLRRVRNIAHLLRLSWQGTLQHQGVPAHNLSLRALIAASPSAISGVAAGASPRIENPSPVAPSAIHEAEVRRIPPTTVVVDVPSLSAGPLTQEGTRSEVKEAVTDRSGAGKGGPCDIDQYVTLDQICAYVNRSKKTLERHLHGPRSDRFGMPEPDVEGGGGRPHEWKWSRIRPWLEQQFHRPLPEQFPKLKPSPSADRH